MKPSQCEACRAVGPTVMCNLCPTGPRRSVQPPATPQEPDLREDIERHNAEIQRLGNAVRDGSATPEMAYAWLTHPYVCTSDMVKAAARIMASAPPAVWQPLPEAERPDYETLDPGIRDIVRLLNDHGFDTTDSGDGVSKPADWYASGCALPFPNVAMRSTAERMIADADRAKALLGDEWTVEASYSALDRKVFLLARTLDDLERLAPARAPR